ncbi:MAG: serine hydrolase domain-containing protein [Microthrixaceae bacterium]
MTNSSLLDQTQLEKLRAKINDEIDSGRMPAAQFSFAYENEVILTESFGDAGDDTLFNIFSATKALIAGVVWQLIDEGKLSRTTLVRDILPEFGTRGTTSEWMGTITLENLLTHTSGFPTAPLGPPKWDTRASRLEVMSRWRCTWEPGTRFEYHPTAAHWVVGEMIAEIEGRDHRDVVNDRILGPLGLSDLHFGADNADLDVAPLVALGETPTAAEIKELTGIDIGDIDLSEVSPDILVAFNEPSIRAVGIPGAGGASTSAGLALFYQALLHNPDEMWSSVTLADGTASILSSLPDPMTGVPSNRSLGLVISGDDGLSAARSMGPTVSSRTFGHNGAGGQIVWGDPESGISFVFLTSAIERNFISEVRRILSITAKAGLATQPAMSR